MSRLAIVVVSHETRDELLGCLASLRRHPPSVPHEVVVVDNASEDGSPAAVRGLPGAPRLIRQERNVGYAAAANAGIRATSGELVLLLNADTVVPPGAVDRMVQELEDHPGVAVLGPRLVDSEGRPELSFGPPPGPLAQLCRSLLARAHRRGLRPARRIVQGLTRSPRGTGWVSGACLLVRRRDAVAAGLLDERFFLYFEDVDFCAAVRALGREVRFSPAAEVVHLRGRAAAAAPGAAAAAYRRGQLLLYRKHRPGWRPVLHLYLRWTGKLPPGS